MQNFKSFLQEAQLTEDQIDELNESMADLIKMIKGAIHDSVKNVAGKVKAWAMSNLKEYEMNGKGEILKKIINNPEAITKQLMQSILVPKSETPITDKYVNALDDAFADFKL